MKKGQWPGMLFGLIVVFALFQWSASALGSVRGEAGVIVGAIVVAATLVAERYLFRKSFREAAKDIGLSRPKRFGLMAAVAVSSMLLLMVPLFLWQSGSSVSLYPNWLALLPGLFLSGGNCRRDALSRLSFRPLASTTHLLESRCFCRRPVRACPSDLVLFAAVVARRSFHIARDSDVVSTFEVI